jgi:hypothetical protein
VIPVHWLLELTIDGHVYRLAEVDLDVRRTDGSVLHYAAGLEVQPVTEALSLLAADVTQPEAQVRIWLDDASLLSILRARGELARWTEGTTWESRRRVLVGACQSPKMESREEGIETTIAQDAWRDSATMIAASQAITASTWTHAGQIASLTDGDQALAYPIVIGRPGRVSDTSIPAMVAPWLYHAALGGQVDADGVTGTEEVALLVAGHHVAATQLRVSTETDTVGVDVTVINTYDAAGQPVAAIPFFFSSDLVPNDIYGTGQPYHFGNDPVTPTVYGLGHPDLAPAFNSDDAQPAIYVAFRNGAGGLVVGGVEIRAAGDVLSWALSQSGAGLDRIRMAAALAALQSYQIDAVIAVREDSRPWDWVRQVLLPILPCSLAAGPDGLYVVALALDAVPADAVARLDTTARQDIDASGYTLDTSRLVRSVTLRYKYNVKTGVYTDKAVYGSSTAAAADPTGQTREHPSLSLAEAWGLQGDDLVVETAAVYDAATAQLIAYTLARLRGLPAARLIFDVPEEPEFLALERGSVVYVRDERTEIAGMAQVESIETRGDGSLGIGVWWVIDPSRGGLS